MKAILVGEDESRALEWRDVPTPNVGPDSVLVEVRATAVNRADLLQRRGFYPPPPGESQILGLEVAGIVAETGREVTAWRSGDRVFCLLAAGGYAQYVAVHADMLLPIPPALDFEQAAAVPEAFYTAFVNLVLEAGLGTGESVLIHAGGSGVGTAAIQLAQRAGAQVFVTAGSDDKIKRCIELGAQAGVNYKSEDFKERLMAVTEKRGLDVVLDCVGASYLDRHLALLRTKGRLVVIGLMGGTKAEIDLAAVVRKRLRVIGSVLRSRTLAEKIAITRLFSAQVLPHLVSGELKPVVDSTFDITDVERAHEHVAANRNFGKVVIRVAAR